jgi:hypothetical protein
MGGSKAENAQDFQTKGRLGRTPGSSACGYKRGIESAGDGRRLAFQTDARYVVTTVAWLENTSPERRKDGAMDLVEKRYLQIDEKIIARRNIAGAENQGYVWPSNCRILKCATFCMSFQCLKRFKRVEMAGSGR